MQQKANKLALLTIALFYFAALASPSLASAEGIGTQTVRIANTKLRAMFATTSKQQPDAALLKKAQVQLGSFLDVDALGRMAMTDHWTKISNKERKEFSRLLRALIHTNYLKGLRSNLSYKVKYLGEEKKGEFLLVHTMVQSSRKGRPIRIEIDYLLAHGKNGWGTFDIITDGVGLVENYRAMFNSIIAKKGFSALLEKMRKKLAAIS